MRQLTAFLTARDHSEPPYRKVTALPAGGRLVTVELRPPGRPSIYQTTLEGPRLYGEVFPRVDHSPLDALSVHERVLLKSQAAFRQWSGQRCG